MTLSDYIAVALLHSVETHLRGSEDMEVFISEKSAKRDAASILNITEDYINDDVALEAINTLSEYGFASIFKTPHAKPRYVITWGQISSFDRKSGDGRDDFVGALWYFDRLGQEWLRESFESAFTEADLASGDPDHHGEIPASDRYVSIGDNAAREITDALDELSQKVAADNSADVLDREIAISEIAGFRTTIMQPKVPADLIERFATRILSWIRRHFSEALIAAVAAAVVAKLLPFLN